MAIISVDTENFEEEVIRADGPVLVDFWAAWCTHCLALTPVLEELAGEVDTPIVKVDVEAHPELARRYGVMGIPTLLLFRDGKVMKRSVGTLSREEARALLA